MTILNQDCFQTQIRESDFLYLFDRQMYYIIIIFAGIGATMFYNLLASIVRALGDSKTPLYFLLFSSFLNIGLDLLLIIVFGMGVRGAAVATVIGQVAAGITAIIQPGGSVKDQDSIDMANKHGIAMVFTGVRHFKH